MNSQIGKKSRERGRDFELAVRKDLESKGWIVCRFDNNVEWDEDNINRPPEERKGKLTQAKRSFNPFTKRIGYANGFPDFIAFKRFEEGLCLIGIECKVGKYLDAKEKEKLPILREIFKAMLIAYKKDGKIRYENL